MIDLSQSHRIQSHHSHLFHQNNLSHGNNLQDVYSHPNLAVHQFQKKLFRTVVSPYANNFIGNTPTVAGIKSKFEQFLPVCGH